MQYVIGVDFWTLIMKGGFFMWPILLAGIVAACVAAERLFVLYVRANVNAAAFMASIQRSVLADDIDGALRLCNAEPQACLPRVVKAALVRADGSDDDLSRALEEGIAEVGPIVNRRIGYLTMLANVATLMGLLGTIAGLIQAFAAVADAPPETKQLLLADGIAIAMYTTAGGLMVAVPTLVVHSVILSRANKILDDVDRYGLRTLNLLTARRRGLAAAPKPRPAEAARAAVVAE
jgi:biopolymer transport protein ExbB/TolQ